MQRTVSTTKRPFRTLSQVTMEMWSNAHTKYSQGYHKLMSTDSSGRVYIPSSKTWDELEGEDWKAKLAALNTEDWLAKFKKFLLKTSTCRWDTLPDAGDIDSWLRWYAASPLHRRGSPTIVACIVLSFHVLVPLPTNFSADYQRQLSEIGITMGCLCDKKLSCWHILLYTIVKRGEGCVPQAADMRLAVRFLSHEPSLFCVVVPLPFRVRHNVAKRLVHRNRCCRRCARRWAARPGSPAGTVLLR